jgi:type IV secretion system protein VirB2
MPDALLAHPYSCLNNTIYHCHGVRLVKKRIHFENSGVRFCLAGTVSHRVNAGLAAVLATCISGMPGLALAQSSPFMTGATALQTNILAWLTPIAIILVMVLGAMAMAARMSWGWCIGAIFGIAMAFGAPQIVTWVRGMFGV